MLSYVNDIGVFSFVSTFAVFVSLIINILYVDWP